MDSALLKVLNAGSIGAALEMVIGKIVSVAAGINVPEKVVLVLGLILVALVGAFGYKYIKLLTTGVFAVAGFVIGFEVFTVVNRHFAWNLPGACAYIVGVVMLFGLGYLAFKKFAHALFGMAALAGFVGAYLVHPDYFLAIAAAVIVSMVSMYFIRYAFTAIIASAAAFVTVSLVSSLVPTLTWASLTTSTTGKWVALGVAIVYFIIQMIPARKDSAFSVSAAASAAAASSSSFSSNSILNRVMGKKRVKIRRVFDIW